jgi:hypothetical protein
VLLHYCVTYQTPRNRIGFLDGLIEANDVADAAAKAVNSMTEFVRGRFRGVRLFELDKQHPRALGPQIYSAGTI